MKKLNRKGYLTIEIILASTVAFVIAFFLIDLTMKLMDNTDNAYMDTTLVTDKALIMKNIRQNLKNDICIYGAIKSVSCVDKYNCEIEFENSSDTRQISINDNTIKYMDLDNNVIYQKKIDKGLSDVKITSSNFNGYYNFEISGTNIFVDNNYNMNIFVYNGCE